MQLLHHRRCLLPRTRRPYLEHLDTGLGSGVLLHGLGVEDPGARRLVVCRREDELAGADQSVDTGGVT